MINPNDIKIEIINNKKSNGGQQVMNMNVGVRLTYIPNGTIVEYDKHRSQFRNKEEAMKILESILNGSCDLWLYSNNEESFYSDTFYTKDSAIQAALEDEEMEDVFYVGKQSPVNISGVNVSTILENVAENTAQGFDGFGDDYLEDVKGEHMRELEDALDEVLFKWIEKYNYKPDWYEIVDIEMIRK